jgi:hypothetical protein
LAGASALSPRRADEEGSRHEWRQRDLQRPRDPRPDRLVGAYESGGVERRKPEGDDYEHDAHGVRMSPAEVDEGAEKRGRRQVLEPREFAAGHLPDAQGQEEERAKPHDDEPGELHPAPAPVEVTHTGSVRAPRCARIGAGPDRAYGFPLTAFRQTLLVVRARLDLDLDDFEHPGASRLVAILRLNHRLGVVAADEEFDANAAL